MQFQKKEKRQTTVRFDSHHVRLRTGEVQRKTGSYMYRWTDKLGKRNTIYAATLEDLREQEEHISCAEKNWYRSQQITIISWS